MPSGSAHGLTARLFTLISLESALILGAVGAAAYLRLGGEDFMVLGASGGFQKALVIVATCQLSLYFADLYDSRVFCDHRELFVRMLQALGATSLVLAVVYYWFPDLVMGRGVFAIASGLVIALVMGWRLAFDWLTGHMAAHERLLLVGTNQAAVKLARELHERRHEFGVEIVGFIDPDIQRVGAAVVNPGVIGTVEDIPAIARARGVDRIVVSLSDARGKLPMGKLLDLKLEGMAFDHLASVYEEYTGKIALENLRPSWLIFSSGFRKSRLLAAAKRLVDVTVALVGLCLTLPVLALLAVAVKLTSAGPALYQQRRVGQHGRVFTIYKLRSMRADAEAATGAVWAARDDDRITRIGRFLRRSRLDELPQLWNVICGDMSLVGPRPERPEFVKDLTRLIPFYGQRHVVRPGLTGWAQVRYTYGASVEDAMEKLQYDLYYIKNMTIGMDLFILLATFKTVILHKGA